MINDRAQTAVLTSCFGPNHRLRWPRHDSYGFNRLPATLDFLLTGDETSRRAGLPDDVLGPCAQRYETVILLLVDGFGWHLFQHYASHHPFLARLVEQGVCSPITAQFPSTTAAHMTTLHTGLPVSQSGIFEWFYYEPRIDAIIAPLLYSLAGDRDRETLLARLPDPTAILPSPRRYQALAEHGIACAAYQPDKYSDSTYSTALFAGAARRPYDSVATGIDDLARDILRERGPRHYFFYIDTVDARSHSHGVDSPEFAREVHTTFSCLEERLYQRLAGRVSNTLLMLSADHGQVSASAQPTDYINVLLPELTGQLRRNRSGELLRFGGSPRDLFLYVAPEHLDEVEGRLSQTLAGRAEVWRTAPLLSAGLFGPPPCDRLQARLGDLVILPHAGHAVFWLEEGKFHMRHKGSHGGLTPEEMDTGIYLLEL